MKNRVFLANPKFIDENNLSESAKSDRYNKLKQRIRRKSVTNDPKKNIGVRFFFAKPLIQNQGPFEFTVNINGFRLIIDENNKEIGFEAYLTSKLARKNYNLIVIKENFIMNIIFPE